MNPIELPISAKLDIGDAVTKAQALNAELDKSAKLLDKSARAAKRLQDRMANVNASGGTGGTGGGGGSSFPSGTGVPKPTKITADPTFFDKIGKALLGMRPASIAGNVASGNMAGVGRMGLQSLLGALGEAGGAAGLLGLGAVGLGAGYIAVNKAQTDFKRSQMLLSSAVTGGPNLGSAGARGLQVASLGQVYNQFPSDMQSWAQTLAQQGVSGRGNQLLGTLSNTAAFAGAHGMKPADLMPLAGTLATQGGMSEGGINHMFQDLGNVAGDTDVSISQIIDSMKTLSKTATGAARDVVSLAAVQHLVGASSGINVGQIMNPVLSMQGGSAIGAAALLGVSPDQFIKMQSAKGGSAQMFDKISGLVKKFDKGSAGTGITEQMLQNTGLLDLSGLSPEKAKHLLDTMKNASPDAAMKEYQKDKKQVDAQHTTETSSLAHWSRAIDDSTDSVKKFKIWLDNVMTHAVNPATNGKAHPVPPGTNGTTSSGKYKFAIGSQANFQGDMSGMKVANTHGGAYARGDQVQMAWKDSGGDPRIFALMMAQMSQESSFRNDPNPKHGGAHPGYGIAQFTDTLGAVGLKKYLGSSDPAAWHRAALDPNRAMQGLAAYDADLLNQTNGNMTQAASLYNTGSAAPSTYGNAVGGVSQGIYGSLDVTVTVKPDGTGHGHGTAKVRPPKGSTGGHGPRRS